MQKKTEKNDDILLYREFLNGNMESFNKIVKRYREQLIYFIYRYVKDIEIAEDISQDTFVYVLVNKKEYDFKYNLKTYLYTIAKCRAINYLKKYKKEYSIENQNINQFIFEEKIESNLIKEENKKELQNVLKNLPEKYQNVIYLKYFKNFKYKEISIILNITMPKVKILIHRAKKMIESNIKKEEFTC